MRNLKTSIKNLLDLERPLPRSIADRLRLGDKWLLSVNNQFLDISSELRIWTIYETEDSELSGYNGGFTSEVRFGAPLVSIKSGILGLRQEEVFSVDSTHAKCASFGRKNLNTMAAYLGSLVKGIEKAEVLSGLYAHTPLRLKDHVKVELIGFYEDPDSITDMRLYFIKQHLSEFLYKGPEMCLDERLGRHRGKDGIRLETSPDRGRSGIIPPKLQGVLSHIPFWNPTSSTPQQGPEAEASPDIVVTGPSARPSIVGSKSEPPRPVHSLTVPFHDALGLIRPSSRGSNGTTDSAQSEPTPLEPSPPLDEHRAHSDEEVEHTGETGVDGFDSAQRRRAERAHRLSRNAAFADLTAGFSRPNLSKRMFMWIHVPFTNPLWVKVSNHFVPSCSSFPGYQTNARQDIFEVLGHTHQQNFSKLFNNEHWYVFAGRMYPL